MRASTVIYVRKVTPQTFCNTFTDAESKSVTLGHSVSVILSLGVFGFEQSLLVLLIDSLALISHMDVKGAESTSRIGGALMFYSKLDCPSVSRVLYGVLNQVDDNLLDSDFVDNNLRVFSKHMDNREI